MALHTALDIYAACYDLLSAAGDVILNMRRDAKRVFGEKIIDACIDLDLHVRAANMAQEKEPHLLRLLERLEVIEILTRVCRDKGFVAPAGYARIVGRTQSIGMQANGWRKAERERGASQQPGLFQSRQGDIKPWSHTTRRRTVRAALQRLASVPAGEVVTTANSYFGLLRQVPHGHADRARLANLVRGRGHCVDGGLTKTYRTSP